MTSIIKRLTAPTPGWFLHTDVIVVGSGIAGLATAIRLRESGYKVLIVTKAKVDEGSTRWAQGGIAAALDPTDSPREHWRDTVVAGAGLCSAEAVEVLVTEGPNAVRRLIEWGAKFDTTTSGDIALTLEGGHHHRRIAHAGGDATGAEISRALVGRISADPGIELIEHALVIDLLKAEDNSVQGLTLHVLGEGQRDGVGAVLAPAVILATGGIGQVFSQSTNPKVATGDGIAVALRAGAEVADLEFIQFHPTVLYIGADAEGQQPLISEAVRGEGAILKDNDGNAFMARFHKDKDLAPRDIVSDAIMTIMNEQELEHVWLDARGLGINWAERFPSILESLESHNINPETDLIPVAPAQHYHSGGIKTDLYGRSNLQGLFACGEVACTGVHGANRLASNSLLEGLVFAERIAAFLASGLPERRDVYYGNTPTQLLDDALRRSLQHMMSRNAGVSRSEESLTQTLEFLSPLLNSNEEVEPCAENWEMTNLHTLASAIAYSAKVRTESRGSHRRSDYPDKSDAWLKRIVVKADIELTHRFEPVPQVPDMKEVG